MNVTAETSTHMTTTEPAPMMFRISTVVKLTGLSRSVIYEQIRAGRLRTVKQGSATLITAAALDDYVRLLEKEARCGQ
jgi:excisionase family DNA binding protein